MEELERKRLHWQKVTAVVCILLLIVVTASSALAFVGVRRYAPRIEHIVSRLDSVTAELDALDAQRLVDTVNGLTGELEKAQLADTLDSLRTISAQLEKVDWAALEQSTGDMLAQAQKSLAAAEEALTAVNDAAEKLDVEGLNTAVTELLGEKRAAQLRDDVELLGAGREFDMDEVQKGRLSPVFFGSALTNFGVEPFLEEFLRMTPSPLAREADCGVIDPFSPDFSAFVFKIQANMNKAHRDRLAFMRICSGKFERDAEYYHIQGGKKMRLSQPQQLMASEREIVDEAYAGDIIGVFDPGIFSIGDTICTPGKKFRFGGIPTFAPEHFSRVSPRDSMKRKQFIKGTEQIAQEGAIQIFKLPNSGMEEVIVGVVGTLQFDVFQYRMKSEYGVDLRMEGLPYEHLRFIAKSPVEDLKDLNLSSDVELLEDYRGHSLLVFSSLWSIDYTIKRNPGLELSETLN